MDENIRRLLERFDASTSTDENNQSSSPSNPDGNSSNPTSSTNESEEIRSYIRQLNTWLREDLDAHLKQRLDFSTKAIVKLVRVFDKYVQITNFHGKFFSNFSLSDKYQRFFNSINSSSKTGESNSKPGK